MNAVAELTETTAPDVSAERLFDVCRTLGSAQGIEFRRRAGCGVSDRTRSIAELCAANDLRHRKIVLRDGWWKRDIGHFLAFRLHPEKTPVAVLSRRGGYDLADTAAGLLERVDAAVAAGLSSEAYVFYRPLPSRPLTLFDLLRAGMAGRARDVGALLAACIVSGLLALLTPLVTRRIVDSSIVRSDRIELWHMAMALIISALAAAVIELARGLTVLRFRSKTAVSLQAALWDRLLALPVSFFRDFTGADLNARAMGIDRMQNLLTADVTGALFSLFPAACSLSILFLYSWPLALLVSLSTLLLVCVTVFLSSRQLRRLRALHRINGRLGALAYALLSGIAKLRVSGAERQAFDMWADHFGEQRRQAVAVQRHSNLQSVIAGASAVATSIGLFAIVGLSSDPGIGVGDYMAFSAALAQFQSTALTAIGVIPVLLGFVPAYERMQPILQTVPESHTGQRNLASFCGDVELRHVSFRYEDGPPVLEDISIAVAPGEFVALVGPSGSGKSTCLRLMLGFERPEKGAVLIDGHQIETLSMRLIRREMGVVMQNGKPLVGDIFHNIIGSLPLNLNDAWRAARFVGLEEEIRSMPMGMFTVVNARGITFSGGQRQRLLLARAVVRRPRVLLLDEATSALDNQMQQLVGRNLATLGATRIAVAHRLSTVRHADRIYVLDRGRIAEQGKFDELIARGGLFARMAERQVL